MDMLYTVWIIFANSFILFLFVTEQFKTKTKWFLGLSVVAISIGVEYFIKGVNPFTNIYTYIAIGFIGGSILAYIMYLNYKEKKSKLINL